MRVMAQLAFSKSKSSMVCTDTVTISNSVLAQRIQQFSMTLIGRLMNPACQNMESLIANFPKIWKLEEKVVGADLGQGVFQFNFEEEEDILSVLQNGPYHFDSWMVSLVRWEPVISSSYPSAINFWVKVSGIPMHLWEVATLEAIGKKLGKIQEVDEETGSLCVSVNGFNPLIFKMVVPFASSDEIVVSLEYEKLTGVCDHCSRITHDAKVCPGILKSGSGQVMDEKMDNRGGQRQTLPVKQEQHRNIGGWEKPRKHAKRALDFQSVDNGEQGYFPQQRYGGGGPYGPRQHEHPHGPAWGQRRNYGEVVTREEGSRRGTQTGFGESSGKAFGFHLNRKSVGLAWPKPLFKVKQASAEKQAPPSIDLSLGASGNRVSQGVGDQEGSGFKGDSGGHLAMDFEVETDDLLEDGEFDDTAKGVNKDVQIEAGSTVQGLAVHSSQGPDLQGDQGSETQVDSEGDPQGNNSSSVSVDLDVGVVNSALAAFTLRDTSGQKRRTLNPYSRKNVNRTRIVPRVLASPGKHLLLRLCLNLQVMGIFRGS
ncbi:PREDICTED: uncharacterized protein LOC104723468 isoform X2 [Camelina sativa]|uniref:Uncharacterized protein LOC104723468 isoform X2 n=1 Tax=Camelina sativa TaxID=90675 RepID=A0ABM0UEX3_CAMSA|nr:PREDICTED: uncharacterized protein LOC104723468 isoform X2 [Camelina sativa]